MDTETEISVNKSFLDIKKSCHSPLTGLEKIVQWKTCLPGEMSPSHSCYLDESLLASSPEYDGERETVGEFDWEAFLRSCSTKEMEPSMSTTKEMEPAISSTKIQDEPEVLKTLKRQEADQKVDQDVEEMLFGLLSDWRMRLERRLADMEAGLARQLLEDRRENNNVLARNKQ